MEVLAIPLLAFDAEVVVECGHRSVWVDCHMEVLMYTEVVVCALPDDFKVVNKCFSNTRGDYYCAARNAGTLIFVAGTQSGANYSLWVIVEVQNEFTLPSVSYVEEIMQRATQSHKFASAAISTRNEHEDIDVEFAARCYGSRCCKHGAYHRKDERAGNQSDCN